MTFFVEKTPRSRALRTCRECGGDIQAGEIYTRYCYVDAGQMIHSFHCMPCDELGKALCTSRQLLDRDSEGYIPGDLFEEAAEHCEFDQDEAHQALTTADQRKAMMDVIADIIAWEREDRRQQIAARKAFAPRLAAALADTGRYSAGPQNC